MAFPMKMNHGWQKSLGCKHWKLLFFLHELMNEYDDDDDDADDDDDVSFKQFWD